MLFNTPAFGLFLLAACVGYWALARFRGGRLALLLGASYYFYACWDARFLLLIAGVTLIDYLAARALEHVRSAPARLYLVAATVGLNLGLLGFWKYSAFFCQSLAPLLQWAGAPPVGWLDLVLPVGISFFTFQGLSYVIDVYRRDIPAERSLFRFALYIAFFPQLVAGPIVRATDLLHQFDKPVRLSGADFGRGLWLILTGLLKKVILADYLAANLIDRVFDLPSHYSSLEVLFATYGYSLQIYGDFSGYTDIAIGTALLLGFHLPANFNLPYRADGLRDFWRRWHISLSTWLRDYLYVPLGGSRGRSWKTYRNLIITMVLGGLWHGASFNFVVWGAFHGLALMVDRALERRHEVHHASWAEARFVTNKPAKRWPRWLRVVITFHVVTALWVFFRADTFSGALAIFSQIARLSPGHTNLHLPVVAIIVGGFGLHYLPSSWRKPFESGFVAAPSALQAAAIVAVLYVVGEFASAGAAPFIYFQF